MASVLTRRTLARAALALNVSSRQHGRLPALILMTDATRLPDPRAAVEALPKGSAVILRHTDAHTRAELAVVLAPLVKARDLIFLIADDPALAARVRADGLHCSEKKRTQASHWRARRKDWLITTAAHSSRGLLNAANSGAHAAILGAVFPTTSHLGRAALGLWRFCALATGAAIPVYALGGIDAQGAKRLVHSQAAGIAAIGGLIPDRR